MRPAICSPHISWTVLSPMCSTLATCCSTHIETIATAAPRRSVPGSAERAAPTTKRPNEARSEPSCASMLISVVADGAKREARRLYTPGIRLKSPTSSSEAHK
eukprot:6188926-Pleurochrysis_carterae.AAC.3